jgi:hypothetical protein
VKGILLGKDAVCTHEEPVPLGRPKRVCMGDPMRETPPGSGQKSGGWCGKPATHVARRNDIGEWFSCVDHTEGADSVMLIDAWWVRAEELWAANDAVRRLGALELEEW